MSKEKKELNLNCPVVYTLSILGGKWKWLIIYMLFEHQLLRYGELKRKLVGITHKMKKKK